MKNKKGSAEILFVMLMSMLLVEVVCFVLLCMYAFESKVECSEFKNYSLKNIPVRCLDYYQIKVN